MEHLMRIRSSEELYDFLDESYLKDRNYLTSLMEKDCDDVTVNVCQRWLNIFDKTAINEKRQRNFLVHLMIRQLEDINCITLPFTNLRNCDQNLVTLVRDYLENEISTTSAKLDDIDDFQYVEEENDFQFCSLSPPLESATLNDDHSDDDEHLKISNPHQYDYCDNENAFTSTPKKQKENHSVDFMKISNTDLGRALIGNLCSRHYEQLRQNQNEFVDELTREGLSAYFMNTNVNYNAKQSDNSDVYSNQQTQDEEEPSEDKTNVEKPEPPIQETKMEPTVEQAQAGQVPFCKEVLMQIQKDLFQTLDEKSKMVKRISLGNISDIERDSSDERDSQDYYVQNEDQILEEVLKATAHYPNKAALLQKLRAHNRDLSIKRLELRVRLAQLTFNKEKLDMVYENMKSKENYPIPFTSAEHSVIQEHLCEFIVKSINKYIAHSKYVKKHSDKGLQMETFHDIFAPLVLHNEEFRAVIKFCDKHFEKILKHCFDNEFKYRRKVLIDHNENKIQKFKEKLQMQLSERTSFSEWYRSLQLKFIKLKCFSCLRNIYSKMFSGRSESFVEDLKFLENKYLAVLEDINNNT